MTSETILCGDPQTGLNWRFVWAIPSYLGAGLSAVLLVQPRTPELLRGAAAIPLPVFGIPTQCAAFIATPQMRYLYATDHNIHHAFCSYALRSQLKSSLSICRGSVRRTRCVIIVFQLPADANLLVGGTPFSLMPISRWATMT